MNLHHDKDAFEELLIGAANELMIPTETEEASPDEGIRLYTDNKYKIVDEVEMD